MIVKNLNIKEFRGIKCCKRPIEFTKFTVLIGRNNSGKTTILEALSLLPHPTTAEFITSKPKIDFIRDNHGKDVVSFSELKTYKNLLYQYAGTSIIEYNNIGDKMVKLTIDRKKTKIEAETTKIDGLNEEYDLVQGMEQNLIYNNFNKIITEKSGTSVLFIPYNTEYIRNIDTRINNLQEAIIKDKIHVKVAKSLNKCVDDEYSEILFGTPIRLRKVFPDNFTYIRINDLGSGAEKLVKIMALIEVIKPSLILLDDFEVGYHPTMLEVFLKWLIELDSQVVVSTHSIDVLYRLTKLESEDIQIVFLKKSQEDILSYKIYNPIEIENYLDTNTDPRVL